MPEPKKCFIIMPITTPDHMIDSYRDGREHFKHVLECLLVPAVEKAGYEAVPPIAKGADLIHAEIIRNLEISDMVLCDLSCLNPNVFFEFGIRTSLNMPICVVKDELTKEVPFDAAIINHHQYKNPLEVWEINAEIEGISNHLIESDRRSSGTNQLWKYLGFKSKAQPYAGEPGSDEKIDHLIMQMDVIRESVKSISAVQKLDRRINIVPNLGVKGQLGGLYTEHAHIPESNSKPDIAKLISYELKDTEVALSRYEAQLRFYNERSGPIPPQLEEQHRILRYKRQALDDALRILVELGENPNNPAEDGRP